MLLILVVPLVNACASPPSSPAGTRSGSPRANDADGADDATASANGATPTFELAVPCNDALNAIYGDPGPLPRDLGAIIACNRTAHLSSKELASKALGYMGTPFTSGADVYTVLYRTERGDAQGTPGTSSALVYVPDHPRANARGLMPVVVTSHGTKGQGRLCASSRHDYDAYMNYPLVGAGFAVIAPDLAGYANFGAKNNPPSAYASANDVGKSTLDGARALRKMFPASFTQDVVLVGHSQGGGTALAALAIHERYGCDGKLAGVVAYAPLWLSLATWGAMPLTGYTTANDELVSAVAIWYLYGQGELHDGAGHGVDAFRPELHDDVKAFVENACYPRLSNVRQLGASMKDIYASDFIAALAEPARNGGACKDDTCRKWKKRMNDDRPHMTGAATQVPILLPYGAKDDVIAPPFMACAVERLESDGASLHVCQRALFGHADVVGATASYVNDWIAARTLGAPEPAGCDEPYVRPACEGTTPNEWP